MSNQSEVDECPLACVAACQGRWAWTEVWQCLISGRKQLRSRESGSRESFGFCGHLSSLSHCTGPPFLSSAVCTLTPHFPRGRVRMMSQGFRAVQRCWCTFVYCCTSELGGRAQTRPWWMSKTTSVFEVGWLLSCDSVWWFSAMGQSREEEWFALILFGREVTTARTSKEKRLPKRVGIGWRVRGILLPGLR